MAKIKAYPEWKVIAWRGVRVFVASFIGQLALLITQTDLETFNVTDWKLLIVPAVSAGLVALGKWIRDKVANGDYTNLIHRLPL